MEQLTARRVAYFVRLYNSPKENGCYRTLAEVAEGHGYSPRHMSQILKDAGVTLTRGKRPSRLNKREYIGKQRGRFGRVILTLPKLRARRHKLGIAGWEICETLGVYRHWISNLENNMLRPTPERIRAYADGLNALDTKKSKNVRAAALSRCRNFEDKDGVDPRPKARKPTRGSWGHFLDGLSPTELMALKAAIAYRSDAWRTGRKPDKLGRRRGVNKQKIAAAAARKRRAAKRAAA
jgi:transcriptional regulator with XRE-family HTH domain